MRRIIFIEGKLSSTILHCDSEVFANCKLDSCLYIVRASQLELYAVIFHESREN